MLVFQIELGCGAGCVSFMGYCVVLSVVFPSIFLCGVYSVCGGGNSQARFWILIVSIHCTDGMGLSVLIFQIELGCGAGGSSFMGSCVVPSVVFFPSIFLCGVYSVCGGNRMNFSRVGSQLYSQIRHKIRLQVWNSHSSRLCSGIIQSQISMAIRISSKKLLKFG